MPNSELLRVVDHLVFASPTLEQGCDAIERLLGIRPQPGGQHPQWGTHNALLGLGTCYFEVIAPDPSLPTPEGGRLLSERFERMPHLATWAVQGQPLDAVLATSEENDLGLGALQRGSRRVSDGSQLSWTLTDLHAMPMDGAVPFFLDWGETRHPSRSLPEVARLSALRVYHPNHERLEEVMELLGLSVEVFRASETRIEAELQVGDRCVVVA